MENKFEHMSNYEIGAIAKAFMCCAECKNCPKGQRMKKFLKTAFIAVFLFIFVIIVDLYILHKIFTNFCAFCLLHFDVRCGNI